MNILFITSTRLGDGVLSTGALHHLAEKYPAAKVTVACGPLVEGVFKNAPQVVRVIALAKEPYAMHWKKLWLATAGTKWDIVVDLRNSLMSRMIRAGKKYIWSKSGDKKHKVEQIADVIGASPPPAPVLWFDHETLDRAESLVPAGSPVLAVGPAANSPTKTWPAENFVALIQKLTAEDGILPHARIAVFAAPGEEEQAYKVLNAFPENRRIDAIAKTSPMLAAAAIRRCDFYIGNDSGLMHCAAAAGVPTLGLFGPSWPQLYHPWGPHAAYVSTPETFDELKKHPDYPKYPKPCLMTTLTVDAAYEAAVKLMRSV